MGNRNDILFTSSTKMADVILTDYRILNLLPRFGMRLGFGEKSLTEVCLKYGVDEHFFILVCNIHTFDDYCPDHDDLTGIDIDSMLRYLRQSHDYYINTRIASIERKLALMAHLSAENHHKIICQFFSEYKQEVLNHFRYEDEDIFPNIQALFKGEKVDFHITQYEENHFNIDDKLSDLKSIIIKYLPEDYPADERNDILSDIFLFEEDLTKHTRIEEKVLIPYVRKIEQSYAKQ